MGRSTSSSSEDVLEHDIGRSCRCINHGREAGSTRSSNSSAVGAKPLVLLLLALLVGVAADFEMAGHIVDTSSGTSLRPAVSWIPFPWLASLGELASAAVGWRWAASQHKQWYVELERGLAIDHVQTVANQTGAAFGLHVASGVHVITGTESAARELSGKRGVRWVGARPSSHKVDKNLQELISATSRASDDDDDDDEYDEQDLLSPENEGAHTVKSVVAIMIPPEMHAHHLRTSSKELAEQCSRQFEGRAMAWEVSPTKVLVSVQDLKGGGLRDVVGWLALRWEVMHVEAKPLDTPMVRYASKLLLHNTLSEGLDLRVSSNLMALPEQGVTFQGMSFSGEGKDGSYSVEINGKFILNGKFIIGSSGILHEDMLVTTADHSHIYYTDTSGNHTSGIQLAASAELTAVQGSLVGMQVVVFSSSYGPSKMVSRLIVSYDAATRVVGVSPKIDATVLAGYQVSIRPNIGAKDVVTVRVNADAFTLDVTQTLFKKNELIATPRKSFTISCPTPLAAVDMMPTFHSLMGYKPPAVTCSSSGGLAVGTLALPDANPVWDRGINGSGQIIGVADTGVDYSNCLLSESAKTPWNGESDLNRRKVVAYNTPTACELCDGCPKKIPWDRMRFQAGVEGQVSNSVFFGRAWPHQCQDAANAVPKGCADVDVDNRLEPRMYHKFGAMIDIDIESTSPPGLEYRTEIRVFVLNRDDFDAYMKSGGGKEVDPLRCLNPNCGTKSGRITIKMLKLPAHWRGYGVIVRSAMFNSEVIQMQNSNPEGYAIQFYTASIPCGDQQDDALGHGTLVAGIAAGSLAPNVGTEGERIAAGLYEGVAKDAKVFVSDLSAGSAGSGNLSIPLSLTTGIFQPAWDAGVRVHTNSWSCFFPQIVCEGINCVYTPVDWCNKYSSQAAELDAFVWEHQELVVLVAAGDTNSWNEAASSGSIRSPGTCKNCISVGSAHSWNAAIKQAVPYMKAMDGTSSPLGGMRPLCPTLVSPPPEVWTKKSRRQTSGQTSVPITRGPHVPYLFQADCCNATPGYNNFLYTQLAGYTEQYKSAMNLGQEGKARTIQETIDMVKGKFYPCSKEPHCCSSNIPYSSCCLASYDATRMPWEASSVTYGTKVRDFAYDIHRVADTSAKGPPKDSQGGRYKPDMVAPGTWIVGANSRGDSTGNFHCSLPARPDLPFDGEQALVAMGGSSVATAVMAGAAALVRQYFTDGFYPSGIKTPADSLNPSASLIKATLIMASASVEDDAETGSSKPVPDFNQGWGRPSLPRVMYFADQTTSLRTWFKDEKIGFYTEDWVHSYEFLVDMSVPKPTVTVVLAYTDPPSQAGSSEVLVNDLDLNVTDGISISIVSQKACPIDPFTQFPVKGCNLPISDRVNNVEKAVFNPPFLLKCTYTKATTTEYKKCADGGEYGALLKVVASTDPVSVWVKVRAYRIVAPCITDGFFKQCTTRKQPYSLVVQGHLLTRNGEIIPPIFSSEKGNFKQECVGNITLCAIKEDAAAAATVSLSKNFASSKYGGGDHVLLSVTISLFAVTAAANFYSMVQ